LSKDLPAELYTAPDLLAGYEPDDPNGFTSSSDFGPSGSMSSMERRHRRTWKIRQRQAMRVGKDKTEPRGSGYLQLADGGAAWLSLENPIISWLTASGDTSI
jgi:hypothetical protein